MTHQVLARKWRPRDFESLVGQDHVVRALSHALATQRLHHAYLFTGTRGVGKTTIARILAKALNCETGVTARPCGTCRACTEIDGGRFVDYIELDAASNRGVDEMTQLLENAVYAPTAGRYKVYVIDEVHMLSTHAFNAMLKTLEEPPAHVMFVLATTDPQRVPVTVLSRCLQFNLKNMPPQAVAEHLAQVLAAESIAFDRGALDRIGRSAAGSMRDALSLLDQAIAFGGGEVRDAAVREMLGVVDGAWLLRILQALGAGDGRALVALADEMLANNAPFERTLIDLAALLQRIALAQVGAVSEADDAASVQELAAAIAPEDLQVYYQIAIHGARDLPLAPDPHTGFTMTLLRLLAFRPDGAAPVTSGAPSAGGQQRAAPLSVGSAATATVSAAALRSPPMPAAPGRAAAGRGADRPAAEGALARAAVSQAPAVQEQATPVQGMQAQAAQAQGPQAQGPQAQGPQVPGPQTQGPQLRPSSAAPVAARPAPKSSGASRAMELLANRTVGRDAARGGDASGVEQGAAPAPAAGGMPEPAAYLPAREPAPARELMAREPAHPAAQEAPPWEDIPPEDQDAPAVSLPQRRTGASAAPPGVRAEPASAEPVAPGFASVGPASAGPASAESVSAATTSTGAASARSASPGPASPGPASAVAAPGGAAIGAAATGAASDTLAGFDGNWAALAERIVVNGFVQQFMQQSELIGVDGSLLKLRVPIRPLAEAATVNRVRDALSAHFGQPVRVEVEVGAVRGPTAAAVAAQRRAERLAQAQAAIEADPFVRTLLDEFDGSIVPGSVRPVDGNGMQGDRHA